MGLSETDFGKPHYFLHRTFLGDQDLLIIFNTKRCRYQCDFCELPAKSSRMFIEGSLILSQFLYTVRELKHSLSVLDRVTLSNEGSVLDNDTFPRDTLLTIACCINELRRVRSLVLETRLEFVVPEVIQDLRKAAPRVSINILTGFETHDPKIRDEILFKRESLEQFESGLNKCAEVRAPLTAYVLYKPSPYMTDDEAFVEASKSIDYVVEQCQIRNIQLTIRLNPMYAARGSIWAKKAQKAVAHKPPRLTDVLKLAEAKASNGIRIYIGLSTEGLSEPGTDYRSREDFSASLLKKAILFNNRRIAGSSNNITVMSPTTLERVLSTGHVQCNAFGISVAISPDWVVEGENRVSSTTMAKLVESCREWHWRKDVIPFIGGNTKLDSITKSLHCEFIRPIRAGQTVDIVYKVHEVRDKGYSLDFELRNSDGICANFRSVQVLWDPIAEQSVEYPRVTENLRLLKQTELVAKDEVGGV